MTDWQDWINPQEQSRREMARPLAFSAVFHLLVVLAFAIGWPFLSDREPMAQPLMIIDMVDIVPDTNLQPAAPMEEKQTPLVGRKIGPEDRKGQPDLTAASSSCSPASGSSCSTPPPPSGPAIATAACSGSRSHRQRLKSCRTRKSPPRCRGQRRARLPRSRPGSIPQAQPKPPKRPVKNSGAGK